MYELKNKIKTYCLGDFIHFRLDCESVNCKVYYLVPNSDHIPTYLFCFVGHRNDGKFEESG